MEREIKAVNGLQGVLRIPGDKSISHRSLICAALAQGTSSVQGLLLGGDNRATWKALEAMGVTITQQDEATVTVEGVGLHGLQEPENVIDCGNSGTTIRLLSGLCAGQPFTTVLTGDPYLRRRPMARVTTPLTEMGARIWGRQQGNKAPLAIAGGHLHGMTYHCPVASAQVKSAMLLAGLFAEGPTWVYEPRRSRDHTERMLQACGVALEQDGLGIGLDSQRQSWSAGELVVPGDISSAAFFLVAATVVPGADVLLENVGINPTRSGILAILRAMGACIDELNPREQGGEPVADLHVRHRPLQGITISGDWIPQAIDELPVIAVAASLAEGETLIQEAAELRVKETDRIAAMETALNAVGGHVEALEDGLRIHGQESLAGGASVSSQGDHRIAMSMAVAALRCRQPVAIQDTACTATSYPDFWHHLQQLSH